MWEIHLFDGLVHYEPLRLVVHHPESVAVNVQDGADGLALRTLWKKNTFLSN